ncbi:MAG: leucine-rich repeat domain-containing protein [Candidatus Thorarchaeota archaeon]
MSNELSLVIRCAKMPAKNYHFIFLVPAGAGSEFSSRRTDLEWVKEIDEPARIDISSNRLTEIDLSPLEGCKTLEYLSLAVNKLERIDLTPLETCESLRHLDLAHNAFTEIDLTPLAGCRNLTYLYLQENKFRTVNIAPLLELKHLTTAVIQLTNQAPRPRIVIDTFMSNVPPNLNDILFSFYTKRKAGFVPEWLHDKNTKIEYSPKSYRDLVAEFGWSGVKKHLRALSKKFSIKSEFQAQKVLLEALDMPELACYDGRVRNIVKLLPTKGSYEEGVQQIYSKIVDLLEAQLQYGGSTLYFDLDALSTTPGSVLLPSVLTRRDAELSELVLYNEAGKVDLFPLWLTSYGHKILSAMNIRRYVSLSQLTEINDALKNINHEIAIEKVVYDARKKKTNPNLPGGHTIQSYVQQTVSL